MHSVSGYGIVFNEAEWVSRTNHIEYVAPGAFTEMLKRGAPVFVNLISHDWPAASERVELFADGVGLGFRAYFAPDQWQQVRAIARTHPCCSVNFTEYRHELDCLPSGACRRIVEASIDHLTLCGPAVYGGTGWWPSECHPYDLPPRLAKLANSWAQGWAKFETRQRTLLHIQHLRRQRCQATT